MADQTALFIRGAQIAKVPPAFESVEGLTDAEKEAIRNEVLHKWRQPKALFFTIILCSIGAAVYGWDQTGSNGEGIEAFELPGSNVNCMNRCQLVVPSRLRYQ
jgi:hypothetical protein